MKASCKEVHGRAGLFTFCLALAAAFTLVTSGQAAGQKGPGEVQIDVESVSAALGSSVNVNVNIVTNGEQPCAVVLRLVYDTSKLTFVRVALGEAASQADKTLDSLNNSGVLALVVYGKTSVIGDGCLLTVTFMVKNTAQAGEKLSVSGDGSESAADPNAVQVPVVVEGGFITVLDSAGMVATPEISPSTTTGQSSYQIVLSCATQGATIRYTIDGSEPLETSAAYSGAFTLAGEQNSQKTVKAKAWKSGMIASNVASRTFAFSCSAPAAPAGVAATDGTFADKVRVTWSPVSGAEQYRVFRDGTAIGDWQSEALYDDTGAQAPNVTPASGCGGQETVTYKYHTYTVKARNTCGESNLSASNSGYRRNAKALDADLKIYEEALPFSNATPFSELAIRLTSAEAVDPATVWARVEGDGWYEEGGTWRPTAPGDDSDGWVVFAPGALWPADETVILTGGALTATGVEVGPVSREFLIGEEKESTAPAEPAIAEMTDSSGLPVLLADVLSPAYRIGPEGVFDQPVPFWIPVPEGADPNTLEIYYFSEAQEHRGWYRGENVLGWMTPDSRAVVEEDGQLFIEIQVNHSGIVQLADARSVKVLADAGVFLAFAALLGMRFARRNRRK